MYLDRVVSSNGCSVLKVLHLTLQTGKVNLQLSKQDMYKLCVRGEYVCQLSCRRVTFVLNINCVVSLRYNDGTHPRKTIRSDMLWFQAMNIASL